MQANLTFEQLQRWSSGITAAVSATLPEEISAHFTAGARGLIASDQVYIGLYLRDGSSMTIYERDPDRWNHNYDTRKYHEDPFFRRFAGSRQDFLLPLSALDKGDFHTSAYYRDFYEPSGSFDEITGVFNFDRNAAGFVTYLRQRGARPFGADDIAMAEATAEATRRVLERLWRQWRPGRPRCHLPISAPASGRSPFSSSMAAARRAFHATLPFPPAPCATTSRRSTASSASTLRSS